MPQASRSPICARRKRRLRLSGVPCAVVLPQAWSAPRSPCCRYSSSPDWSLAATSRRQRPRSQPLLAFDFEAGSPSLPPELATKERRQKPRRSSESGTTQRHALGEACVACRGHWLELHERQRIHNGTLDRDLESARYALLVKIKGEDYARNRQRLALTSMWTPGTRAI